MLTANEAKQKLFDNPSFERKLELYKEVSEIIETAVENGKKSFNLTEEQHRALGKELIDKGYTQSALQFFINSFGGTHPYNYSI